MAIHLKKLGNLQQLKSLVVTLFELSFSKYGPDHYLSEHIKESAEKKDISGICARAKNNAKNIDWLKNEGYFAGNNFETFKKNYLKEFTRQQRARHCLKKISKTFVEPNLHFEQVLAYVYHTTGEVPYPF